MKDKDPISDQEKEFFSLRDQIIGKLANSDRSGRGVQGVQIVREETEGGTIGLTLCSDGEWIGRVQMMGIPMGTNPEIEDLLDLFAWATGDQIYNSLLTDDDKKMRYVRENKERFLNGLTAAMKSSLENLSS